MGIPAPAGGGVTVPPAGDKSPQVLRGSFTATGQSAVIPIYGAANLFIYGNSGPNGAWTGSAQLERSFDGGTTWVVCGVGGGGAQAVYTTGLDVSVVFAEPEQGMLYRLNCTDVTGTINYRISVAGISATAWGIPSS